MTTSTPSNQEEEMDQFQALSNEYQPEVKVRFVEQVD